MLRQPRLHEGPRVPPQGLRVPPGNARRRGAGAAGVEVHGVVVCSTGKEDMVVQRFFFWKLDTVLMSTNRTKHMSAVVKIKKNGIKI